MPAAQAAAPSNDDFASAQTLLTGVTTAGTNVDATAEVGEPDPQDDGGNGNGTEATVWYEWTAPTSGSFIATTASSDIDTYLAVFTGSSVDSLTPVHEDDDDPSAIGRSLPQQARPTTSRSTAITTTRPRPEQSRWR